MELLHWLESTVGGEFVFTFLVSMIPIVELRGGIPFGVALGLPYPVAFTAAVIGNILPAPFIIVYIRRIFQWMRRRLPRLDGLVDRLEKKASVKGDVVNRYKYLGLMLFVGIPLPGTGAWTGSLAAALMKMDFKSAMLSVALGTLIADVIMCLLSYGLLGLVL